MKTMTLPPRTKLWGWDYHKQKQFRMTGKEWHQYVRRETFKHPLDRDARDTAWSGTGVEVWLDGTNVEGRR